MTVYRSPIVTGVILAGGLARRMGGQDKGLLIFQGQTMVQHALNKLVQQVDALIINANRELDQYQQFGHPVMSDELSDFQGPLSGMLTALKHHQGDYILTLPCDSPYLSKRYRQRMMETLLASGADIAVATDGQRLQPVFALIPTHLQSSLEAFLQSGERKIDRWFAQHHYVEVDFSDSPEMFINFNTPEDLERSTHIASDSPILGIAAFSGTGKTTLLKQLLPTLKQRGIHVAVVKHAHHQFDIDKPGKDSYELRESGANPMVIASSKMMAYMQKWSQTDADPSLPALLATIDPQSVQLILVEGFKHEPIPKLELHRPSLGHPLLFPDDQHIVAIATDDALDRETVIPQLNMNDVNAVADFVEHYTQTWTSH
jgi:molybdenum cofactor guanylyltransferase/molybdopterin-guanine dinucleotide biosynthesis protein MobB